MKLTLLSTCLLIILFFGCNSDTTGPATPINLINNSSFEIEGVGSLAGWWVSDTTLIHVSQDVPPGYGGHSVAIGIASEVSNSNIVADIIKLPQGLHTYRLSVWYKTTGMGEIGWMDNTGRSFYKTVTDSSWTYFSRTDTLTVSYQDTLNYSMDGGFTRDRPPFFDTTWFYNPRFEILD
jgi:hypothetical protein